VGREPIRFGSPALRFICDSGHGWSAGRIWRHTPAGGRDRLRIRWIACVQPWCSGRSRGLPAPVRSQQRTLPVRA